MGSGCSNETTPRAGRTLQYGTGADGLCRPRDVLSFKGSRTEGIGEGEAGTATEETCEEARITADRRTIAECRCGLRFCQLYNCPNKPLHRTHQNTARRR